MAEQFDEGQIPEIAWLLDGLFVNRRDTYAEQQSDGSYLRIEKPLTLDTIKTHLRGNATIGVYVARENTAKWMCFDFDGVDNAPLRACVVALYRTFTEGVVKEAGLKIPREAIILEGSGRRGYHLWVFFAEPVPLEFAYELGMHFVRGAEVPETVKEVRIEVFPKQAYVHADGFGALVKLPLGVHRISQKRGTLLSPSFDPVDWQVLKTVKPWSPPVVLKEVVKHSLVLRAAPLLTGDYPCWVKISEGNIPAGMRHDMSLAFASHLRDRGLSLKIALAVMSEWWARLPQPPQSRLDWRDTERAVRDAYARSYYVGCSLIKKRWPEFCSSDCPIAEGHEGKPKPKRLIMFRVEEPTDRIEICGGEYVLEAHGPHTVLYSPVSRLSVSMRGRYTGWDPAAWEEFTRLADRELKDDSFAQELGAVRERCRLAYIGREPPVADDDSQVPHTFWGLHSVVVRHSRKNNYIAASGDTYRIRDELRKVKMRWDPGRKVWTVGFDEHVLKRVTRLAGEADRVSDPVEAEMVTCRLCRTWVKKEEATEGKSGCLCGCLRRLKEKMTVVAQATEKKEVET